MSLRDILAQYVSFVSKVEKGKFKWGSRRDLAAFEQQLIYAISLEHSRVEPSGPYRPMEKTKVKVGVVGE